MNKLDFAIVGIGNIGKKYSKIIGALPNARLLAGIDTNFEQRKNLGALLPFFTSVDDFIASNIPADVVCICTPNGLHPEHTIKCLKAGYHVVCEKPVALTTHEVQLMIEAEKQSGKHVFAVMQNRYSPVSMWLKTLLDQNKIGDLLYVQVNCFWNRNEQYYQDSPWRATNQLGGGPLYTQFSHFIDLLIWLTGNPKNIQGTSFSLNPAIKTDFDDSGNISFDLKNGGKGSFNYTTAAWDTNIESSITIIGSKGNVKVGGQYMERLEYINLESKIDLPVFQDISNANNYKYYKGSADKHDEFLKRVIECIKEGREPEIGLQDEIDVINFIEQALLCLQSKSY